MTCSDREPLLRTRVFLALLLQRRAFSSGLPSASSMIAGNTAKDLYPRNKWKQEHCYIEGFNHGTAKKN